MTDQEIKVKALELSAASLTLLPKENIFSSLDALKEIGLSLPDFVIRESGIFDKYIRSSKTAGEFIDGKIVR